MFQTRDHSGDIREWHTLLGAFEHASENPDVWKISFDAENGERIRLIRTSDGWLYEDVFGNRHV